MLALVGAPAEVMGDGTEVEKTVADPSNRMLQVAERWRWANPSIHLQYQDLPRAYDPSISAIWTYDKRHPIQVHNATA